MPKIGVIGQRRIICGSNEAFDKPPSEIALRSRPGVEFEHRRLPAARLRIKWRPAEYLRPVTGQPLDVLRMARVRKRVVQFGVVETALVVGGRESQESGLAAGKLEHRWTAHRCFTVPLRSCGCVAARPRAHRGTGRGPGRSPGPALPFRRRPGQGLRPRGCRRVARSSGNRG